MGEEPIAAVLERIGPSGLPAGPLKVVPALVSPPTVAHVKRPELHVNLVGKRNNEGEKV